MSEWKPIETAPENQSVLLLLRDGRMTVASMERHETYVRWILTESGDNATDDDLFEDPTHWMELPELPK
jgi:hypothetical protein